MSSRLIIVVDDSDGVTNVYKFTSERKMLEHVQYRDIKYIQVFEVEHEIKLIKRPAVIIDRPTVDASPITDSTQDYD